MSVLHEQRTAAAQPDAFLALLLGARARLARGERLLLAPDEGRDGDAQPAAAGDDTALLAALGWIALHRRLASWIEACRDEVEGLDPPQPAPRTPRGAGLLR